MPTLCGLHLSGCLPVSASPLLYHFLLFHLSFFFLCCMLSAGKQVGTHIVNGHLNLWLLYTQCGVAASWKSSFLPHTIFSVYHVSCLLHAFFQIRWERDVGNGCEWILGPWPEHTDIVYTCHSTLQWLEFSLLVSTTVMVSANEPEAPCRPL